SLDNTAYYLFNCVPNSRCSFLEILSMFFPKFSKYSPCSDNHSDNDFNNSCNSKFKILPVQSSDFYYLLTIRFPKCCERLPDCLDSCNYTFDITFNECFI